MKKDYLIKIFKSERKLQVWRDGAIVAEYDVDLGLQPVGKKHFEGGRKTPEGKYYISAKNPKSNYYLALKISYPNFWNKIYAWAPQGVRGTPLQKIKNLIDFPG